MKDRNVFTKLAGYPAAILIVLRKQSQQEEKHYINNLQIKAYLSLNTP